MGNEKLGTKINCLDWSVLNLPPLRAHRLLTSDRPVVRWGLDAAGGHIIIPIGPQKLFVAAKDDTVIKRLHSHDPRSVSAEVNKQVVGQAVKYVYGEDEARLSFVKTYFGSRPQVRILQDRYDRWHPTLRVAVPPRSTEP
jgi:hypothetical protein